jgi:uncharacterized membrane protein (Fun14 family)
LSPLTLILSPLGRWEGEGVNLLKREEIMNFDTQIITKCTLGFFMGISVGILFRYFLFRILLFIAIPIILMLILDYTGIFSIDWLFLEEQWSKFFTFLSPATVSIYDYINNHILIGLIPGIFTSRFFFMRR